jgi:hypothetical protein
MLSQPRRRAGTSTADSQEVPRIWRCVASSMVVAGGTGPDPGRRPVSTRANGPTVWPFEPRADSGRSERRGFRSVSRPPESEHTGKLQAGGMGAGGAGRVSARKGTCTLQVGLPGPVVFEVSSGLTGCQPSGVCDSQARAACPVRPDEHAQLGGLPLHLRRPLAFRRRAARAPAGRTLRSASSNSPYVYSNDPFECPAPGVQISDMPM